LGRKSILIIKPSSLGDIVHTLPAVAAIRDANPDAAITWVINPEWATILRGNRDVDHVHIFPRKEFAGLGAPRSLLPWLRKTRAMRPDIAVDFQGLLRSALIAKISGAKEIYGMSDGREGSRLFYHHIAKVDRREHAVERYLKLAAATGATIGDSLRCPLPTGDHLPRFDEHPPFILLHPFARGNGKSLSVETIEAFCHAFAPARVVVVGKSKRKLNSPDNCVELTNQTTLLELVRLIRAAHFVISVDSGPMHIAAAITDRLISIHNWTNPRRVGPYNADAWVWKNGAMIRVADLEQAGKLRRGRRFKTNDVAPIARFVIEAHPLPAF
ncbi:MAG: glycosyltransferase family 9 protein, partial [Chthoniobacterales bacterium]